MLKVKLIFVLTLYFSVLFATEYADTEYYLLDSIDLTEFSEQDLQILDSCLEVYHNSNTDTERFTALSEITNAIYHPSWTRYNEFLEKELNKIDWEKQKGAALLKLISIQASVYNNLGMSELDLGNMSEALKKFRKSKSIATEFDLKDKIATALNNEGYVYQNLGDLKSAIESYDQCISIRLEINAIDGLNSVYINMGNIYFVLKNEDKAKEYYNNALKISKEISDYKGEATALNNLGSILERSGDNDQALVYYQRSVELKRKIGDEIGVIPSLVNVGDILLLKGEEEEALKRYDEAMDLSVKLNYPEGIWLAKNKYADLYFKDGNYVQARKFALECLKIAGKIGYPENLARSNELLSKIEHATGNHQLSLNYYKEYILMRDSVLSKEAKESTLKQELKYEFEKEQIALKKEQEKREALIQEAKQRQFIVLLGVVTLLILVIIFTIFLYNRYKIINRQKDLIQQQKVLVDEKNEEIESSIKYAKRIQEAILPPSSYITDAISDHFVFYRPKSIVAGDFYWIEKVDDYVFFAAADCTGHGVPGAMVSVVCSNALTKSVKEMQKIEPKEILDTTSSLVIETFAKSEREVMDGMDIALCRIDLKKKEIVYAGAHNPLYIVSKSDNGDGELTEIKGDRQPIGKSVSSNPFNQHVVKVKENDVFFMFSDGFPDQFGGPEGRKFMYKPFKRLLLKNAHLEMNSQLFELKNAFKTWSKGVEQIDDVLVIGFSLKNPV